MISATTAYWCKILSHVYSLCILWILAQNRFLQTLRNPCENMQATTALSARRSFPPGVQDSAEELRNVPRAHLIKPLLQHYYILLHDYDIIIY